MGQPAHRPRADGAQLRRRRDRPAAACSSAPQAAACWRSTSTRGIVGWDGTVANPKGATELERIADVTSLPLIDGQQVCAVAYQGRVACFDITRGTLNWSRDVSSLYGLAGDGKNIYVTDDKGAVQALDRSTGASVWKQDRLAERKIGGPQVVGDLVAVVDVEGYVHLLVAAATAPTSAAWPPTAAPPTSQPALFLSSILWQSAGGNLYAVNREVAGVLSCCRPSRWSAGPTSASRRCSIG